MHDKAATYIYVVISTCCYLPLIDTNTINDDPWQQPTKEYH